MPNLVSQLLGVPLPTQGLRPQRADVSGLNYDSPQANGLVAAFPLFGHSNSGDYDLGPMHLFAQPVGTDQRWIGDPQFGMVFQGDGSTANLRSLRITSANAQALNFGTGDFSVSLWFNTTFAGVV